MRARLVFWKSVASGMGANAVDKKPAFPVFRQQARAVSSRRKSLHAESALVGGIQDYLSHGQASLRARTTLRTHSPLHNGSSIQLDTDLHMPDLTGF